MVHPSSLQKTIWDFIIVLLLVYTATVMPFKFAFIEDDSDWLVLEIMIDLLFFLDVIITFFSAYYDDAGNIITDRRKIALNYIKTWFFIDILACIPFDLITMGTNDEEQNTDYNGMLRLLRLPRLWRLIRISRFFKILKNMSTNELIEKIKDTLSLK